jgi:hypothetical protein
MLYGSRFSNMVSHPFSWIFIHKRLLHLGEILNSLLIWYSMKSNVSQPFSLKIQMSPMLVKLRLKIHARLWRLMQKLRIMILYRFKICHPLIWYTIQPMTIRSIYFVDIGKYTLLQC